MNISWKSSIHVIPYFSVGTALFFSLCIFSIYSDVIMVWNIKYGTLQSWQTLDKITEKQGALLSHVQSNGACCACCIPGFICVGFYHCVAVCQLSIDACSLAAALGQLDSTSK